MPAHLKSVTPPYIGAVVVAALVDDDGRRIPIHEKATAIDSNAFSVKLERFAGFVPIAIDKGRKALVVKFEF
ncbi:MAG: hypothetical protein WAP36_00890, partial [Halanaerobiales bacterium]